MGSAQGWDGEKVYSQWYCLEIRAWGSSSGKRRLSCRTILLLIPESIMSFKYVLVPGTVLVMFHRGANREE